MIFGWRTRIAHAGHDLELPDEEALLRLRDVRVGNLCGGGGPSPGYLPYLAKRAGAKEISFETITLESHDVFWVDELLHEGVLERLGETVGRETWGPLRLRVGAVRPLRKGAFRRCPFMCCIREAGCLLWGILGVLLRRGERTIRRRRRNLKLDAWTAVECCASSGEGLAGAGKTLIIAGCSKTRWGSRSRQRSGDAGSPPRCARPSTLEKRIDINIKFIARRNNCIGAGCGLTLHGRCWPAPFVLHEHEHDICPGLQA